MSVPRILLVDDTPEVLALCAEILKRSYEIAGTAGDGESAISAVEMTAPDVVVLDVTMPRLNGVEVARRLRSSGYGGAIVFLSGDLELMNSAMEAGVPRLSQKHGSARTYWLPFEKLSPGMRLCRFPSRS